MVCVVGIDPSLSSTGIAIGRTGPDGFDVGVQLVKSLGHFSDSLPMRRARLGLLASQITDVVNAAQPDLVVIESPSLASKFGHAHDRSGLWWLIVYELAGKFGVVEVPPSNRMKYATGKGQAAKDVVLTCVVRRYPQVPITGNDEADALLLMAMGMRSLGHPIEAPLPQSHRDAMTKVRW